METFYYKNWDKKSNFWRYVIKECSLTKGQLKLTLQYRAKNTLATYSIHPAKNEENGSLQEMITHEKFEQKCKPRCKRYSIIKKKKTSHSKQNLLVDTVENFP